MESAREGILPLYYGRLYCSPTLIALLSLGTSKRLGSSGLRGGETESAGLFGSWKVSNHDSADLALPVCGVQNLKTVTGMLACLRP